MSNFLNFIKRRGDVLVDRGDNAGHDFLVGNFTRDGAWHDLDLSSIVPSGASWVYVVVTFKASAADKTLSLRKKGNVNAYNVATEKTQVANIYCNLSGWVACDANRIIEYYLTDATVNAIYFNVRAWILPGDVNDALKTDGTGGRVFRNVDLLIEDGTNANTIKCTLINKFNGDAIAATDNISKGATTGDFTLSASGAILNIESSGLSGNVLSCMASLLKGGVNVNVTPYVYRTNNVIYVQLLEMLAGTAQDLTSLADAGSPRLSIFYITDA